MLKLLLIDHHDSFTYNLVHYFFELGVDVQVANCDDITIEDIEIISPNYLVLSPGPRAPVHVPMSKQIVNYFAGKIPILGVCLGHQIIAETFGGHVVRASRAIHGKTSMITHNQQGIFQTISQPFSVMRYHSLIVDKHSLPSCFEITALTNEHNVEEIMAMRHKEFAIESVQFHPESILTQYGHEMLRNFLAISS